MSETRQWNTMIRGLGLRLSTLFLAAVVFALPARAIDTAAETAILIDFNTGQVLFEKDANKPVPPASLAKLMTVEVIFHELQTGKIQPSTEFTVSERAWREGGASSGGSTMFLPLHSQVSVGDLIKGIIIQSGNDATIVAAEGIAGSTETFADIENQRAKEIGLTGSHFANPHGLPDPENYVTARDLATLAEHLIKTYPDQYHVFSEEEFTFNGIKQGNRNPLLGLGLGADGLKTGHTSEAGYCLVASAKQGDRRLVLAMTGTHSIRERSEEARKLLGYGFSAFENRVVVEQGAEIATAKVLDGQAESVPVVAAEKVALLMQRGIADDVQKTAKVDPVTAPVVKGAKIGTLTISRDGQTVQEVDLLANGDVPALTFWQKSWSTTKRVAAMPFLWAWSKIWGDDSEAAEPQPAPAG
ncbi:D-alanyl-D-alanine carboxypeptidase family protein [Consotaella salsifontis]|uniref:serine-type D-Ala-D-Ala carboxypeptidase n=1 Tax=Consotaella salsifontis TaxID=1365950 RepID=A0A1T4NPE8_9HYPH|nr:D-alanyl-D-alanine carboxypeptidase family protein [Consotaella salsifontis]SJZ81114.1 D-alanyl-D-alanine carboxypeptidase (penicillin-binding protein 5/6) [Consotaella salsifontis]